jgi:hypothetical protein
VLPDKTTHFVLQSVVSVETFSKPASAKVTGKSCVSNIVPDTGHTSNSPDTDCNFDSDDSVVIIGEKSAGPKHGAKRQRAQDDEEEADAKKARPAQHKVDLGSDIGQVGN